MSGKIHRLKTTATPFAGIADHSKKFEIRRNDRDFQVGDVLILDEYDPEYDRYYDRVRFRRVIYILKGPWGNALAEDFCVMSLDDTLYFMGKTLQAAIPDKDIALYHTLWSHINSVFRPSDSVLVELANVVCPRSPRGPT